MSTGLKWVLGILAALAVGVVVVLIALIPITAVEGEAESPDPTPVTSPVVVEDGEWSGFVNVGSLDGAVALGFDDAEMLSGEPARQAAVEDGVIAEGEDLPNDFYIDNDEIEYQLVGVADGARFKLISAEVPDELIDMGLPELSAFWEGTYTDHEIYGVPGQPMFMTLTIENGLVASGEAVYLP